MQRFLDDLTKQLRSYGVDSAEEEARLVASAVLQVDRKKLALAPVPHLTETQRQKLFEILSRRAKREPLQYILGTAPFMDLELWVTPAVLIPRPETEILAEYLVKKLAPKARLLDLGTGSGAIALSVKQLRPDVQVTAIDVSSAALKVARTNAKNNQRAIEFIQSDLLCDLPPERQFDFIAANLPYVSGPELEQCQAEVRDYEPHLALFAEQNGTAIIRRALPQLFAHLPKRGQIGLEIGAEQAVTLSEALASAGFTAIKTVRDYNDFDRFLLAVKP